MFARVSTYRAEDAARLVDGFEHVTDPLAQMAGFAGAYFLVDRSGGRAMSMTLWDSEETLDAGVEKANELRRTATEEGSASIESVDHYEVALTVGAVGTPAAARRA
jgi:heme-degrading monooxygenase HmoA